MEFVIGMAIGIIFGTLATCFVVGASRVSLENEIYMEGHIKGYAEGYVAGQKDAKRE